MRISISRRKQRGDTIIEVIFAFVVFSMVAISSLVIMNQGIATGERALEIDLVRNQINAQAEALRFIHDARVVSSDGPMAETWNDFLTDYHQAGASPYGELSETGDCRLPGETYSPFILNARTAQIWTGELEVEYDGLESLPPYSQVAYDDDNNNPTVVKAAYGMWIEAVPSSTLVMKRFIDFHIRACWHAPGNSVPMTIGTIVRLYDPS